MCIKCCTLFFSGVRILRRVVVFIVDIVVLIIKITNPAPESPTNGNTVNPKAWKNFLATYWKISGLWITRPLMLHFVETFRERNDFCLAKRLYNTISQANTVWRGFFMGHNIIYFEKGCRKKCVRDNPEKQYGIWSLHCSWHCSCRTYFCCFPLALANITPWLFVPFFQHSLKNSES